MSPLCVCHWSKASSCLLTKKDILQIQKQIQIHCRRQKAAHAGGRRSRRRPSAEGTNQNWSNKNNLWRENGVRNAHWSPPSTPDEIVLVSGPCFWITCNSLPCCPLLFLREAA